MKVGDLVTFKWDDSANPDFKPSHGILLEVVYISGSSVKVKPFGSARWIAPRSGYDKSKAELTFNIDRLAPSDKKRPRSRYGLNVFILDNDPSNAARMVSDKHISRMMVVCCKLLSHVIANKNPDRARHVYKATNFSHPYTKWLLAAYSNCVWLYKYAFQLNKEYLLRTGKEHKSFQNLVKIKEYLDYLQPWGKASKPPMCMPSKYVGDSVVESYRDFYFVRKRGVARWKLGAPDWWKFREECYNDQV